MNHSVAPWWIPLVVALRKGRWAAALPLAGRALARWAAVVLWLSLAVAPWSARAADAQLTIADGVVVKFGVPADGAQPGAGLWVRDQLRTGAGVVFTSERDDESGPALRATSAAPQRGDWLGVFLTESATPSRITLDGLAIRFAGRTENLPPQAAQGGAALVLRGGNTVLKDLRIDHNRIGIRVIGAGSPQVQASQVTHNEIGVQVEQGATPVISGSSLAGNSNHGVLNLAPQSIVQATQNWWGHATGPQDPSGNPSGQGSRVSAGVAYQPYLAADPSAAASGPALGIAFDGKPLLPGAVLERAGQLTLSAFSARGVSQLEAYLDGNQVLSKGFGTAPAPSVEASPETARVFLRFENLNNGSHTLVATAKDAQGGVTAIRLAFVLDLKAPGAPRITVPLSGTTVATPVVSVAGVAEPGNGVQLFLNGNAVGQALAADDAGQFAGSVPLPGEGPHSLQAQAANARGASTLSAAVGVTLALPTPTVAFVSPAEGAVVRGTTAVQVSAIDASGVAQVQLLAQGAAGTTVLATLTSAPWAVEWNTAGLPDGSYTLVAVVTGGAGKTAQASRAVQLQQIPLPPAAPVLPYTARNVSATPAMSFGDQPVQITGQAVQSGGGGQPLPNATLRLALRVQGFERRITLVSDSAGQFSYTFIPQANDAGTYAVYVVHPDDAQYAGQVAPSQFTINRLGFNHSRVKLNAVRGQPTPVELTARASAGSGATGVRWQALPADQPSGSLPPGITLDLGPAVDVPAGTGVPMILKLAGSASAGATGTVILKAFANESGSRPRAELRVDYELHDATPGLVPSPSFVEIGVRQGGSSSAAVTLTNRGLAVARNVQAKLLAAQGAAPPAWARLISSGDVGDLDVGQSVPLQIMVQPGADVADGYYQYQLRVSADNDAGGAVPVTVAVAQSGQGGVRFKLVDIYTNTLDASGQPIAGVAGATIKLQNEALTGDIRTITASDQGLAEISGLPPGTYRWRASAAQHTDASGRVQVRAGLTANERVFLDNQLVSIEFSVTETTIRDEYRITLEATYQTQVPAPVVLLEPLSISLPDMQAGEEITGELALSNYGLVRADALQFALPGSDASYRYEFFGDMPTELAAKSRVVIPYRVTALVPVKQQAVAVGTAAAPPLPLFTGYSPSLQIQHAIRHFVDTGSSPAVPREKAQAVAKANSCSSYVTSACVAYAYTCASGDQRQSATCSSISRISGASCGNADNSVYGPGRTAGDAGGWGGGSGSSGAPIGLVPACVPVCPDCAGGTGPGGGGGGGGGGGSGPGSGPGGSSPGPGGPGPSSFGSS